MNISQLKEILLGTKENPSSLRMAQTKVDRVTGPRTKLREALSLLKGDGAGEPVKIKKNLTASEGDRHSQPDKVAQLEAELKESIAGEVRFDAGYKAMYSTDASNYRQIPVGVVIVKSAEDIISTVALCRKYSIPVLSRGGGTSLCGQCCNAAIVMDMSKYYNKILEIDYERKFARVQPGLVLDVLRNKAEERHLTFAPDPSTHNHCTLGGMIGNNSCGTHSVMGGVTADNVLELDVLLYDGTRMKVARTSDEEYEQILKEGGRKAEIYRQLKRFVQEHGALIDEKFPRLKRRVSGYNLPALLPENGFDVARALTGSESTLVTVLEAKLRLVPSPPKRSVVVLGYPDIFRAADHIPDIMKFGPIACEGVDDLLTRYMAKKKIHDRDLALLPAGGGWLIVEFGGDSKEESDARARRMMEQLERVENPPTMKLYDDPEAETEIWKVRESGLGGTARVPGMPDTWEGWEDSAVPPEKLGSYLREMRKLFEKYGYHEVSLYGHFGQGCLHCRIPFDVKTVEGIEKWRRFLDQAAHLVVSHQGSISGEHGDGQSKAELLPIMFGDEMIKVFEEFKQIFDPDWMMNPGKVVRPNKIGQNLRLGADYSPWEPKTRFQYPSDQYSFARATTKCVGVGECRRQEGGTMCPSYMATMEEKHSTRGRAHMLFEMLQGDPIKNGWRDENVKEALDLCLSCKGCKSDCPMNVDLATLKSEFLSHYYEGRLRPRHAYAFGLIHIWARIASLVPNLANLFTQSKPLSSLAKFAANVDQSREIPKFATQTFKHWFRQREDKNTGKPDVVLFPDTFNDHFHPQTAIAAVEVLEQAGFHVIVPSQDICCGRPLYDYGMVDMAKVWLDKALTILRPHVRAGTAIVFLEPSCAAVFKDEAGELFPADEDVQRLKRLTYPLSQFIKEKAPDFEIPQINRKVLLQIHCHHKSVLDKNDQKELLKKMGAETVMPEAGCCGMAGAFGYEAENDHCGLSRVIGEKRLLPAVNELEKESLIVADGFSCREQIRQGSDRQGLHFAQALRLAGKNQRPDTPYPERKMLSQDSRLRLTKTECALSTVAIFTCAALALKMIGKIASAASPE